MKAVIMTLDNANKIGIAGAEKLTKTDSLIFLYVNGKKNVSDELEESLENVKAEVEYVSMASNSDMNVIIAYYAGLHNAKNHDVFVVTPDKDKINAFVSKNIKVYTGFKSIISSSGSSKSSSSSKKTSSSSSKKTTSSSSKKTTSSSSKKTTTAKKTSTAKKKTSKKKEDDLTDILTSLASGKLDTDDLAKKVLNMAKKNLK